MASRLTSATVRSHRQMASVAATAAKAGATGQIQATKLGNGLSVAALDTESSLTSVGILVKAGSKYETYETLGVTHAMRRAAGLAAGNSSALGLVRNIQQAGSNLTVVSGRDYVFYSLPVLANNIGLVSEFLMEAVSSPLFKTWEVSDSVPKHLMLDLAQISPEALALELLHKAAYRNEGLGNSIFSPEYMVGKHKPAMLHDFHAKHYTFERSALVGVGIDLGHLTKLSENLKLHKGTGPVVASKYVGGEQRHESGGKIAFVAMAGEGPAATSATESVAYMILQKILGVGPRVHGGSGAGILQQATAGCGTHAISGINNVYHDSSLTGFFIASDASCAGEVVSKAVAAIRTLKVTDAQVDGAKKALSIDIAENSLNKPFSAEVLAAHALLGGAEYMTEKAMLDAVSKVTIADVQAAAKKLSNAKPSIGACGNLSTIPFLDSI